MTRDEILNMPAGREMDELIAVKVMGLIWDETRCRVCGWKLSEGREKGCVEGDCSMRPQPYPRADEPAPYSTNISNAWMVIEKLNGPVSVSRAWKINDMEWIGYSCWFGRGPIGVSANAETAPLAICRAALLVVMT